MVVGQAGNENEIKDWGFSYLYYCMRVKAPWGRSFSISRKAGNVKIDVKSTELCLFIFFTPPSSSMYVYVHMCIDIHMYMNIYLSLT